MRKVITVDGPSGVGKGTLCQTLARERGWAYLDSGALYRLLALQALAADKVDAPAAEIAALVGAMQIDFRLDERGCTVLLNGAPVGGELRTERCGNAASKIAAYPEVRAALLDFQRGFGGEAPLIADGRDMGTVVFPDAPLKLFLTASAEIRAERRYKQLLAQGESVNLRAIYAEIAERDARDRSRSVAPLIPASDAVVIDTGNLSISDCSSGFPPKLPHVFLFPNLFYQPESSMESFAELFEKSIETAELKPGSIIKAEVVQINKDFVVLNAGLKSEGFVPAAQFTDENGNLTVAVGDTVEVALEALEDGFGETKISHEKAQRIRTWEVLEQKFNDSETITGIISGRVKGGFTVDVEGVKAFLPGSLVDVRPVKDPALSEGKEIDFKIIKLDQKRNNIVISRRAVLENEYKAERDEVLKNLQEGDVVKAVVKNLTDYGAFLDIGGVDGLLHITDMAWKRIKYPSEVVNIGDEVEVKVLKFDRERARVSLGLKQLGSDPWGDIAQRYPVHSQTRGKVTNIADYGSFVEIEDGVEGLVHVSEMDWTNKNVNPRKFVAVGQEVDVMILEIDPERRRISLGMKQCQPNPWQEFEKKFNKGDRVKGQIKSITDFGVFIGLEGGIDGLIHLSDLSWDENGEEAVRH